MNQLLAHLWGDYILQSTWMALSKSKRAWPCALHCFTYTLPFLFATRAWSALFVIFTTHYLIDRHGLARYLVWIKEAQRPGGFFPWAWCSMTGYFDAERVTECVQAIQRSDHDGRLHHAVEWATRCFQDSGINRPIWIRVWLTIVADNTLHLTLNALAIAWLTPLFDRWLFDHLLAWTGLGVR